MNLVLIGFRATGKTTVGCAVAERLGWPFVDTDQEVEAAAEKTIAEIFSEEGEARFRDLEAVAVARAVAADRTVIAVGGGAPLDPRNAEALRAHTKIVLLTATAEEIERRSGLDHATLTRRPALTGLSPGDEIRRLLADRNEAYRELAGTVIDTTDRTVQDIVQQIASLVPGGAGA